MADHRDLRVRAHGRQVRGKPIQRGCAGPGQLLTCRRAPDTLWRVVSKPGNHGYVLARSARASRVIQGASLHRRGAVENPTQAGVEVVSCRGDSRNQNGNPIGRGQISEHLNDAAIATWVERQELTALHGPRREGHPRGLHGPSVDVI